MLTAPAIPTLCPTTWLAIKDLPITLLAALFLILICGRKQQRTQRTSEGGMMICRGTRGNTDSRRRATHGPAGWVKKRGWGREELCPARSLSENRCSPAAGQAGTGCDFGKETTPHAELQPGWCVVSPPGTCRPTGIREGQQPLQKPQEKSSKTTQKCMEKLKHLSA